MSDSPHIYFYFGNDDFAIRKQVAKFSAMFSDPTTAGMNISQLDARTVSENELANAIFALPFLAEQRLVVLENVSKRYTGLDGHKKFVAFLATVPASTRLVLVDLEEVKEKDIPNHWLVKWAIKAGESAKFQGFHMPKQREMPGWIVAEAKRQGGAIEPNAAARLAEMTGEETRQAAQEITKLLTYVNFAHAIGIEDVEAVSIVTASVDIFELVDALGAQNGRLAQKLFRRLVDEKEAFEIFGMIVRQFRMLTIARDVLDESGTINEVTEALGAHPFVAGKVFNQAKNFSMDTLSAVYHRLLAMDESAKTGGMPLETSLEMLIVELAGKRP
ncbi:MAG: DNA polymerase III subunit delta [Chloroflexi bacterium]|nr:DNA polymerase III subunit delta [Chloroflexota bacterium]